MEMEHAIKIKTEYLLRIISKEKTFEVRLNDRDYQVGDILHFEEIREDDLCKDYSHRRKITYVHNGLGMKEGYVVLGLSCNITDENL